MIRWYVLSVRSVYLIYLKVPFRPYKKAS